MTLAILTSFLAFSASAQAAAPEPALNCTSQYRLKNGETAPGPSFVSKFSGAGSASALGTARDGEMEFSGLAYFTSGASSGEAWLEFRFHHATLVQPLFMTVLLKKDAPFSMDFALDSARSQIISVRCGI